MRRASEAVPKGGGRGGVLNLVWIERVTPRGILHPEAQTTGTTCLSPVAAKPLTSRFTPPHTLTHRYADEMGVHFEQVDPEKGVEWYHWESAQQVLQETCGCSNQGSSSSSSSTPPPPSPASPSPSSEDEGEPMVSALVGVGACGGVNVGRTVSCLQCRQPPLQADIAQ